MSDEDEAMGRMSRLMTEVVERSRAERRPRMEDVARVVDDAFRKLTAEGDMDIVLERSGPDGYEWRDRSLTSIGFEKVYVLTGSALAGAEGYPLMTIRQVVAPPLDAQLTFSTLVFGPSDVEIARSVAMLIANHAAAFQGLKESIALIAQGGTMMALERVKQAKEELDGMFSADSVVPKKGDLN